VFAVDIAAGRIVAVKPLAAWAAEPAVRLLRRQQFAAFPHRVFLGGPIPLIAPRPKIGFGAVQQKHPPGALEIDACLVKGGGSAILMFARMRAWITAASPLPRILVMRLPLRIAIVPACTSP
jgi:hypothetical protein